MSRSFDNTTGRVISFGDVNDITGTAFTAAAWVTNNSQDATGGAVIAKSSSAASDAYNLAISDQQKVHIDISDSGGADSLEGLTSVPTTGWHHIGCVKAGTGASALRTYLDGVLDNSTTSNRSIQNAGAGMTIGRRDSSDTAYDGMIAECALWAASLTDGEMAALAKGVPPYLIRPQSLRGYWPLWGTGSPERDLSSFSNDGTVSNGVVGTSHPPVAPFRPGTPYIELPTSPPFSPATLLTDFTGSDENPLSEGGNWARIASNATGELQRTTNQVTGTSSSIGYRYWTSRTFGPDCDAYISIPTKPGNTHAIDLFLRLQDVGGTVWDGYWLELIIASGTDEWRIYRATNGAANLITGPVLREITAGDKVGFRARGRILEAYLFTGGAWSKVIDGTDTTYPNAGYIGFGLSQTTVRADDFFAASVPADLPTIPFMKPQLAKSMAALLRR